MICTRERADFTISSECFSHLRRLYQNSWHRRRAMNLNLICFPFSWQDRRKSLVTVITNVQISQHSVSFRKLKKIKIIIIIIIIIKCAKALSVATIHNCDVVRVRCSPALLFSWGRPPFREFGHFSFFLVVKTKSKEASRIVMVPCFSGVFKTLVSHPWGQNRTSSLAAWPKTAAIWYILTVTSWHRGRVHRSEYLTSTV